MKFYNMGNHGLEYPVFCGSKCVIPAGTKHVKIAFGQSHLVRNSFSKNIYAKDFSDRLECNENRLNVYAYRGCVFHA